MVKNKITKMSTRLNHIDVLRGIAALSVTYFHLSGSSGFSESIVASGKYGYLGVEIFFVISGFILPYSMHRRGYNLPAYSVFLSKRILRIDPPYFVTITICLVLIALTGRSWPTWQQLLAHLGYMNAALGYQWLSPVFWTLAIEFQFYLFLGLAYRGVTTKSHTASIMFIMLLLGSAFFVNSGAYLPHWSGLFILGILTFRYKLLGMSMAFLIPSVITTLSVTALVNGVPEALVGFVTVLFILYGKIDEKALLGKALIGMGAISYSLYLMHWEFGRAAIAVFKRLPIIGSCEILGIGFGMTVALCFSWFLFKLVEEPAIYFSNRVRYKSSYKGSQHPIVEKSV